MLSAHTNVTCVTPIASTQARNMFSGPRNRQQSPTKPNGNQFFFGILFVVVVAEKKFLFFLLYILNRVAPASVYELNSVVFFSLSLSPSTVRFIECIYYYSYSRATD